MLHNLRSDRRNKNKLKGIPCVLSKQGLSGYGEGKTKEKMCSLKGVVAREPVYTDRIAVLWNGYKQPINYWRREINLQALTQPNNK